MRLNHSWRGLVPAFVERTSVMRDTWIDEHTGDELAARPEFRAELRRELAAEFAAPARRRTPWRAIAWAGVVAAAAVTTVVIVANSDDGPTVQPGNTAPSSVATTTSATAPPDSTATTSSTPGTAAPGETGDVAWRAGEIFGFGIGFHPVDEVSAAISAVYGAPTADSGWYTIQPTAPGDEDCLAGRVVRVLHWGDLTLAFQQANATTGEPGEFLWTWTVGDLRASGFDGFREPSPAPAGTPTGLASDGIRLGTVVTDVLTTHEYFLSDYPADDGSRTGQFFPTGVIGGSPIHHGFVVDANGAILGFGTTQSFC
jgi:hypothetical protein